MTVLTLLMLTPLLWTPQSLALSCPVGIYQLSLNQEETDLPINTQIVAWGAVSPDTVFLVDSNTRERREWTSQRLGDDAIQIKVKDGFEAGQTYELVSLGESGEPHTMSTFSIGAERDEKGPQTPTLAGKKRIQTDGPWGPTDKFIFRFKAPTDDAVYFRLEMSENPDFSDAVHAFGYRQQFYDSASETWNAGAAVSLGFDPCHATGAGDLDRLIHARVTAYDHAGNASAVSGLLVSAAQTIESPSGPSDTDGQSATKDKPSLMDKILSWF